MTLATSDMLASFDMTQEILDVSPVLAMMRDTDLGVLGLFKIGPAVEDTTHYWMEDSLFAYKVTADASVVASGDSTMDVATGEGAKLRIGMIIKDTTVGKNELILITGLTTDALTITRGYGYTVAEEHAASAVYIVVGGPRQDGQVASADISQARVRPYNYTQIFERAVILAGTTQATKKKVVPNELAHQVANRMDELKRELAISLILGARSASAGSDTVLRTFGGLIEAVTQGLESSAVAESVANVVNPTEAQECNEAMLEELTGKLEDDGAEPNFILAEKTQINKIVAFGANNLQYTQSDKVRGAYVTTYLTPNGWSLKLVRSRWMPKDHLIIGNSNKLIIAPLSGRQFKVTPMAKTGDFEKRQLLGEYSVEIKNAYKAFAVHKNLTTT